MSSRASLSWVASLLCSALLLGACVVAAKPPPPPPPSGGGPSPAPPPAAAECAPADCGPAMAMPNGKCDDGTMFGPTGRCLRHADGQCRWEVLSCPAAPPPPPPAAAACIRTGCSGSICTEPGNDVMTTCQMLPQYECYATAKCERQANGACGFTSTPALTQCLNTAAGK
ncbi:MAG: hypothetical protein R3B48_04755 [Kofleriaceae bacterium]